MARVPTIPLSQTFTIEEMTSYLYELDACRTEAEIARWLERMDDRKVNTQMREIVQKTVAIKRAELQSGGVSE